MNLMSDLGPGYFGFALKDSRRAAHLVEAYGRIALSSLPMAHAPLAYQLAINHTKEAIEWNQLPFATKPSPEFRIPVPVFAPRVREMEVRRLHKIGSHTFFLAHVVTDESYPPAVPVLSVVHGFYQTWRLKEQSGDLEASVAEHTAGKHGIYCPETHSESSQVAKPPESRLQASS
jgi:flavin reductase (DIM6/NTAB) family NADH-FMN oxidoreductase RutF